MFLVVFGDLNSSVTGLHTPRHLYLFLSLTSLSFPRPHYSPFFPYLVLDSKTKPGDPTTVYPSYRPFYPFPTPI